MKKIVFTIEVLLFTIIPLAFSAPQKVQIKEIVRNPAIFNEEDVEVEGLVTQYVESQAKTTAYYLLKGDYGALIRVNTAGPKPKVNWKYRVTGILYIDEKTQEPFISEKTKTILEYIAPEKTRNTYTPAPAPVVPEKTWMEKYYIQILIAGGGLIVILLLILLFSKKRTGRVKKASQPIITNIPPESSGIKNDNLSIGKTDMKTMIIPTDKPKTMKFIPGKLEIISGEDKGKVIKIAGYPTKDGSIITIGREKVNGPRAFAHIELKERTISRKQAEIISRDGKIYLKNLSETNYSKVNGEEVPPNSVVEINPEAILTFGEVEMKYLIK